MTVRQKRFVRACAVAAALAVAMGCGHSNGPGGPTVVEPPPITTTVVLAGAGDIADCTNDGGAHAEETAKLLDAIPDATVIAVGDLAYFNGTQSEFMNCYDRAWGRHKRRTRPAPGNHEYGFAGVLPYYYTYFGDAAGPPGSGYYSFDAGAWLIISMNSNVPAGPGSQQLVSLADDLQKSRTKCQLVFFHHPRFSSGPNGNSLQMADVWQVMYDYKVDVVVSGHDHLYEVFAEQRPDGTRETGRGIREFVVGTGGAPHYQFGAIRPNSERQIQNEYGVLRLTLHPDFYDWSFLRAPDGSLLDTGTTPCH